MSLYEHLGGDRGLEVVVADFYGRLIEDELIGAWFEGADDERITTHLRAYLAVALGGPELYSGRSMRNAHAGLRITMEAWNAALRHLTAALSAAGADDHAVHKVVALVGALRAVIVQEQAAG